MALDIVAEFDIDIDDLVDATRRAKKDLDSLKEKLKEVAKNQGTSSEAYVKTEASLKKVRTEYNAYSKNLQASLTNQAKLADTNAKLTATLNTQEKSIGAVRKQNKELLAIRNQLDLNSEKGIKANEVINKKLNENNQFIKDNVSAYEQQKIGIGNYQEAIENAIGNQSIFGTSLKALTNDFKNIFGSVVSTSKGIDNFITGQKAGEQALTKTSKALRIFRIAMISTGIGAIVVAIGALVAGFLSTQKGIDAVTRVLAPLKGAFDGIIGVVQDIALNFGKISKGVFGQFKDNFIILKNTFMKGVNTMRLGWAKVFGSKEEVAEIQKEISKNQKEFTEAVGRTAKRGQEFVNGVKQAGKHIAESAKRQSEIVNKTIALEEAQIRNIEKASELSKEIKAQNKLAEDVTKPLAEREAAAVRSVELAKEKLVLQQQELSQEIKILELKQTQNDSSREDLKELAELKAQYNQLEESSLELQTTQQNKVNTIRQSAEAQRQKAIQERAKRQQEAISQQEKLLELYILQEGQKKKGFKEQLDLAKNVYEKEIALIKQKEDAGLSSTEAEIQRINAKQKLIDTNTQLTLENAQKELETYTLNNSKILENESRLNQDLLTQRKTYLEEKARLQIEALKAEGLSEDEFKAKRFAIEQERDNAIKEEKKALKEQEKADQLAQEELDFEEKIARLEERNATEFEIQEAKLARDTQLKIDAVNKELITEEQKERKINLIRQQSAKEQEKIEEAKALAKLDIANKVLGAIGSILDKESEAGKAVAVAQAIINTAEGVTKALAQGGVVGIATGVAVATAGALNIQKIMSAKKPKRDTSPISLKASKGITLKGNSHANGGVGLYDAQGNKVVEAEGGENVYAITNKEASGVINKHGILGALSMINQNFGGGIPLAKPVSYARSGGIVQTNLRQSTNVNKVVEAFDDRIDNIRVINVAEDTYNVVSEEIQVQNEANL